MGSAWFAFLRRVFALAVGAVLLTVPVSTVVHACQIEFSLNGNTPIPNGTTLAPGTFVFIGNNLWEDIAFDVHVDGVFNVRIVGVGQGITLNAPPLALGAHTVVATHVSNPPYLNECEGFSSALSFVLGGGSDTTPPVLANPLANTFGLSEPVANGYEFRHYARLTVEATDNLAVTSLKGQIGSAPIFVFSYLSGNTWYADLDFGNLVNAAYPLVLTASDAAGNLATLNRSIVLNLANPNTPTFMLPEAGALLATRTVNIAGTTRNATEVRVTSTDSSVDQSLAVALTAPQNANVSLFQAPVVFPRDGDFTIVAIASSANRTSASSEARSFRIDTTAPSFAGWQFDDGSPLFDGAVVTRAGRIFVQIADANGVSASSIVFRLNGNAVSAAVSQHGSNVYSGFIDFDSLVNGAHILQVSAADAVGNIASASLTLNVAIPTLAAPTITTPAVDVYVNSPTLTIAGTSRPWTRVQLLLGGVAVNAPIAVGASASFAGSLLLPTDGAYEITARASTIRETSIESLLRRVTLDRVPPTIGNIEFAGAPLGNGVTVSASAGNLRLLAADSVGLQSVSVRIETLATGFTVFSGTFGTGNIDVPVSLQSAANGAHRLQVVATDLAANSTTVSLDFSISLPPPTAPIILSPLSGTQVNTDGIVVAGTTEPGNQVRIFVNGTPLSTLVQAQANGAFVAYVSGLIEGANSLSAEALNSRGTSPRSADVTLNFAIAAPSIQFGSPGEQSIIAADAMIELVASATAPRSISQVRLSIDGRVVATLTTAPYRYLWNVASVANGAHVLSAEIADSGGASASASIQVMLAKPPPPVITPYIGQIDLVAPALSFGATPISVTGTARGRVDNAPVSGAPLMLLLNNGGYQRTINVVTDASGTFVFNFVPQPNDQGRYDVALIHPDENTTPVIQGTFSVERLSVDNNRIRLRAARGFAERFTVYLGTSVDATASNVSLVTPAIAQPSGSVPTGVSATAIPTTVSAGGAQVPYEITFNSTAQSPANGVLIAQLLASESGSLARAEIRIDFELVAAEPVLLPTPSVLALGTRRGQAVSERVALDNRGLVAASGVTARLLELNDAAAPAWLFLSATNTIGTIAAGAKVELVLNAVPDVGVDDGVYQFKLRVSRDVAGISTMVGEMPISVSVTSSDNGRVLFETADIYTNTRDVNNNLILGVEGARISLQNEAVPTQNFAFTTGVDGTVQTSEIPAGRYRWRASAENHKDASGIVVVRPGGNTQQKIFLEYTVVSFEFSVTETTIEDQYDVVITATFQTQVPAPVVIIEPSAINVPPMQVGEQITGEITITNYGLVRADNVVFTPPQSNEYWRIEIGGAVPSSLEAKSRLVLPYKLTLIELPPSGLLPLALTPSGFSGKKASPLQRALVSRGASGATRSGAIFGTKRADQKTGGTCSTIQSGGWLNFEFECANGDRSAGSGGFVFTSTSGASCGGGGVSTPWNPTCTTQSCGNGGGWGGGGSGGAAPLTPGCTPDCTKGTCCTGAGAGAG